MSMPLNQAKLSGAPEVESAEITANEPAKLVRVGAVEAEPSPGTLPKMVNGVEIASPSSSLRVNIDDTIECVRRRDFDEAKADPIIVTVDRLLDLVSQSDFELGVAMASGSEASDTIVQMDSVDSLLLTNESGAYLEPAENMTRREQNAKIDTPMPIGNDDSQIATPNVSLRVQLDDTLECVRRRDFDEAKADPIVVIVERLLDVVCQTDVELMPTGLEPSTTVVEMDTIDSLLWSNESGAYLEVEANVAQVVALHDHSIDQGVRSDSPMPIGNGDSDEAKIQHVDKSMEKVFTKDVELGPTSNPSSSTSEFVTPKRPSNFLANRSFEDTATPVLSSSRSQDLTLSLRVKTTSCSPSSANSVPETELKFVACNTHAGIIQVGIPKDKNWDEVMHADLKDAIDEVVDEAKSELQKLYGTIVTRIVNERINNRSVTVAIELEDETANDSRDTTMSGSYVIQIGDSPEAASSSQSIITQCAIGDSLSPEAETANHFEQEDEVAIDQTLQSQVEVRIRESTDDLEECIGEKDDEDLEVDAEAMETTESTPSLPNGSLDVWSKESANNLSMSSSQLVIDQRPIDCIAPEVEKSNQLEENDEIVMDGMVVEQALKSQNNLKNAFVTEKGESENEKVDEVQDGYEPAAKKPRWEDYEGGYQYEHVFMKRIGQHAVHAETILEVTENQTSNTSNNTDEPTLVRSQASHSGKDRTDDNVFNDDLATTQIASPIENAVNSSENQPTFDSPIDDHIDIDHSQSTKIIGAVVDHSIESVVGNVNGLKSTPDLAIEDVEDVLVAVIDEPSTSQVGNSATSRIDRPVHDDQNMKDALKPTFEEKITEEQLDGIQELKRIMSGMVFRKDPNHVPRSREQLAKSYPRLAIPGFTIDNFWRPTEVVSNQIDANAQESEVGRYSIDESHRAQRDPEDVAPEIVENSQNCVHDPQNDIEIPMEVANTGEFGPLMEIDENEERENVDRIQPLPEAIDVDVALPQTHRFLQHNVQHTPPIVDQNLMEPEDDDFDRSDIQESDSSVEPAPMAIVVGRVEGAVESQPSTSQSEQNRAVFDGEGESENNGSASPQSSQNRSDSATTSAENRDRWSRLSAILDKISRQEPRQDVDQYFHNGDFVNPTRFTEVENFTIEGDVEVIIDNEVAEDVRDYHDGHAGVVDDVPIEAIVENEENNVELEAPMIIDARAPPMHEHQDNDVDMEDIHEHLDINQEENIENRDNDSNMGDRMEIDDENLEPMNVRLTQQPVDTEMNEVQHPVDRSGNQQHQPLQRRQHIDDQHEVDVAAEHALDMEELENLEQDRLNNMVANLEQDDDEMEADLQKLIDEEVERERRRLDELARMAPLNPNPPPTPAVPAVFPPPPHRRRRPIRSRNEMHLFGSGPIDVTRAHIPIFSIAEGIDALTRIEVVLTARDYGNDWNDLVIRLRRLQTNFRTFQARPPTQARLRDALNRIIYLRASCGITTN